LPVAAGDHQTFTPSWACPHQTEWGQNSPNKPGGSRTQRTSGAKINRQKQTNDGGGGGTYIGIQLSINEDDGTIRKATNDVCADDDDVIADAILNTVRGIAALRGPGLQLALAKRLGGAW
jgi:hypothetical protein